MRQEPAYDRWMASLARRTSRGRQGELDVFLLLQVIENREQVARLRVSSRSQHPHQTLGRLLCRLRQFVKPYRSMNVVAQKGLSSLNIVAEEAAHCLREESFPEATIPLRAGTHRFLEVLGQW